MIGRGRSVSDVLVSLQSDSELGGDMISLEKVSSFFVRVF